MPGLRATLVRKIGPLPLWAWGGVGIGGIALARWQLRREAPVPPGVAADAMPLGLLESGVPVDVTGRDVGQPSEPWFPSDWFPTEPPPTPEPAPVPTPRPAPTEVPRPTPTPDRCQHTHWHGCKGARWHHGRPHVSAHGTLHYHAVGDCGHRGCA